MGCKVHKAHRITKPAKNKLNGRGCHWKQQYLDKFTATQGTHFIAKRLQLGLLGSDMSDGANSQFIYTMGKIVSGREIHLNTYFISSLLIGFKLHSSNEISF